MAAAPGTRLGVPPALEDSEGPSDEDLAQQVRCCGLPCAVLRLPNLSQPVANHGQQLTVPSLLCWPQVGEAVSERLTEAAELAAWLKSHT